MVKIRVAHARHGNQQVVAQVKGILGHRLYQSIGLLSVEGSAVEQPRAGNIELIPFTADVIRQWRIRPR